VNDEIRAVALGYQGFGNVGDEAILTGIEELLAGSRVRVVAVVGGPHRIPAYASARRITTHRMRPNVAALQAIARSRVVLISGGGLLHDHWRTVVPTYLAWSVLARLAGARVVWVGVGVGPLQRPISRLLAGWALRLAARVSVRDAESAELVARIAPRVKVHMVPDPAMLLSAPEPRSRSGIGFVVRGPTPGREHEANGMAAALADAATGARVRAERGHLITFGGPRDRVFAETVRDRAAEKGAELSIEELGPDPRLALQHLNDLKAVVSIRLHGVILAAVSGTPVVPIAYDQKVVSMSRRLGLDDICQSTAGLSGARILAALAEAESPAVRERVARRVEEIRSGDASLRSLIEEAAG
jgi:polysaccharide pyruvyl transferase CsaB